MMDTCCFEVRPIHSKEAMEMVVRHHYSRRTVGARFCFGLFNQNDLVGCVVYSQPASYTLCKGVCGEAYKKNVLELSRLVVTTTARNAASRLIGGSLKHLKATYAEPKNNLELAGVIVVSYADCNEHVGHVGYVYQATNWIYTGKGSAEPVWVHPETKQVISYTRRHIDIKAKALGLDWRQLVKQKQTGKHRYVTFAGSSRFVKKAKACLQYTPKPYPKGSTTRHSSVYVNHDARLF